MQSATPTTETPAERSQEFVAVTGGEETTSAEALLVTAYVVMWALLLLFLFLGWRKQRGIERRLDDLERALEPADEASDGARGDG